MTADRLNEKPKSPLGDLERTTDLEAGGRAGASGGSTSSTSSPSNVFSRVRGPPPPTSEAALDDAGCSSELDDAAAAADVTDGVSEV